MKAREELTLETLAIYWSVTTEYIADCKRVECLLLEHPETCAWANKMTHRFAERNRESAIIIRLIELIQFRIDIARGWSKLYKRLCKAYKKYEAKHKLLDARVEAAMALIS